MSANAAVSKRKRISIRAVSRRMYYDPIRLRQSEFPDSVSCETAFLTVAVSLFQSLTISNPNPSSL